MENEGVFIKWFLFDRFSFLISLFGDIFFVALENGCNDFIAMNCMDSISPVHYPYGVFYMGRLAMIRYQV